MLFLRRLLIEDTLLLDDGPEESIFDQLYALLSLLWRGRCGGGEDGEEEETTLAAVVENLVLRSCGLEGGPLRIMPLGDSITESRSGYSSYRYLLWQLLLSIPCNVDFVGSRRGVSTGRRDSPQVSPRQTDFDQDHEGHWDYRADEVLSRIDGWAGATVPHIVLLHLGTNDIFQGQDPQGTVNEVGLIIDRLRAINPTVAVVVAQLIPANRAGGGLRSFNSLVTGLVAGKNTAESPVILANHAENYFVSDNFDGVHPGPSGESKMADTWINAILELVASS